MQQTQPGTGQPHNRQGIKPPGARQIAQRRPDRVTGHQRIPGHVRPGEQGQPRRVPQADGQHRHGQQGRGGQLQDLPPLDHQQDQSLGDPQHGGLVMGQHHQPRQADKGRGAVQIRPPDQVEVDQGLGRRQKEQQGVAPGLPRLQQALRPHGQQRRQGQPVLHPQTVPPPAGHQHRRRQAEHQGRQAQGPVGGPRQLGPSMDQQGIEGGIGVQPDLLQRRWPVRQPGDAEGPGLVQPQGPVRAQHHPGNAGDQERRREDPQDRPVGPDQIRAAPQPVHPSQGRNRRVPRCRGHRPSRAHSRSTGSERAANT